MDRARNLSMNHLDTKYEQIEYKHRINTKYCAKISWIEKINPWSQGKWSKSTLGHWWRAKLGIFVWGPSCSTNIFIKSFNQTNEIFKNINVPKLGGIS